MGEGFAQLASVSAVLGGFTVTFLAVVLMLAGARLGDLRAGAGGGYRCIRHPAGVR
jgi:hypothetical protein